MEKRAGWGGDLCKFRSMTLWKYLNPVEEGSPPQSAILHALTNRVILRLCFL